jgi:hypothetical protein
MPEFLGGLRTTHAPHLQRAHLGGIHRGWPTPSDYIIAFGAGFELAGIAAMLEHASQRPYPHNPHYPDNYIHTNLIETAEYLAGDVLKAAKRFFQR